MPHTSANETSVRHEFAYGDRKKRICQTQAMEANWECTINTVKCGLEVVPFPGIFTVKKVNKFAYKLLVYIFFGDFGMWDIDHKAQEKLVNHL